jgi:hypothetical protein
VLLPDGGPGEVCEGHPEAAPGKLVGRPFHFSVVAIGKPSFGPLGPESGSPDPDRQMTKEREKLRKF